MNDAEKVQIDKYLADKGLSHLRCKDLYEKGYQMVISIIELPYWQDKRFAHMLTSFTFRSDYANIVKFFELPFWNEGKYPKLLIPAVWGQRVDSLVSRVAVYEELLLGNYVTVYALRRNEEQIRAIYKYLIHRGTSPVINHKLHPMFTTKSALVFRLFGVTLDWVVETESGRKNKG